MKKAIIHMLIDAGIKKKLVSLAEADSRNLTSYIRALLIKHIAEKK